MNQNAKIGTKRGAYVSMGLSKYTVGLNDSCFGHPRLLLETVES